MSRLIKTDTAGKQRTQFTKAVMITIRELAAKKQVDDEARDMAAFLSLALTAIHNTIDESVKAWEKRDYWMKADQFRRDWAWAGVMAGKTREAALLNDWGELALLMPEIAKKLGAVKLPKSNTLGKPWAGALVELKKRGNGNK
ncbi:MAG TPA: hypothetical protein VI547_03480 [Anaerolineales bacterium]|nr:hypothetical protein [Anaerolineales bacterium]HLF01009.1 hypothetical protein [Anaerolineales bacterium]